MLLACSDIVALYDIDSDINPINISQRQKNKSTVNMAVFNHNSRVIASGGEEGIINFYNGNLEHLSSIEESEFLGGEVTSLAFNNNSNYLAFSSTLGHLKIWDLKTSSTQLNYKFPNNYVTSMSFNNDSTHLTVGTAGGDILNFNMVTLAPTNFKFQSYFKLNTLKYSPLLPNLVGASFEDGSIKVIDMQIGGLINDFTGLHSESSSGLTFSPINKVFLCSVGLDNKINFFDVSARKHIKSMTCEYPLTSVCFNNDGQTIACGTISGSILVYDLRMFSSPKALLKGHNSKINHLEFSRKNPVKSMNASNTFVKVNETSNTNCLIKSNRSMKNFDNNETIQKSQSVLNTDGNNNNVIKNKINTVQYDVKIKSNKNHESFNDEYSKEIKKDIKNELKTEFKEKEKEVEIEKNRISIDQYKFETFSDMKELKLNVAQPKFNNNNTTATQKTTTDQKKSIIPLLNLNTIPKKEEFPENKSPKNINLDSKVQNFIQNCLETEMFKLKEYIHEEINALHVDFIRQNEIQKVNLYYF